MQDGTVPPLPLDAVCLSRFAHPRRGVVPDGYKVLKEGAASVLLRGNDVFYNEAQVRSSQGRLPAL